MIRQENKTGKLSIAVVVYAILFISVVKLRPLILYDRNISIALLISAYCVFGFIGIYLFRDDLRKGISEWKEHGMKNLFWLIGGFIADVVLENLSYYPQYAIYPDYEGINDNNIAIAAKLVSVPLFIVAAGIFGPITEEFVFRFIITDKLRSKIPAFICIILSSVLFMMWHMHALTMPEFLANLPKLTTGLIYSVIMLKSKNPTIPLILHVFNNTSAFLILFINSSI